AALRRCTSVRAGQSVPITSTGAPLPLAAASMRAPRSPSGCGLRTILIRATILRKLSWVASGAQHTVTGPILAARAVATARSVNRSCRTAAACAPMAGMRRVLAKPGIGAFARIAIDTRLLFGGDIAIALRESPRIDAEEIR